MPNCNIIALANQKGGVGKTTTAVNLGIGLARQGKSVLIIDTDAQANATLSLGYHQPDELHFTLGDVMQCVMEEKHFDPRATIFHHQENVHLLPANIELSGVEAGLINAIGRENVLKRYVDQVKNDYDYILLDCPPSLSMLTINSLAVANSVVIPSQPHYLSARGLDLLLRTISKVKRQINPNLRIDGILLTMVNRRTQFSKEIIQLLRGQYGQKIKVFETEIPISIRAVEASEKGKSIYAHDKNGKVAAAYENFTKEVLSLERHRNKSKPDLIR